MNRKELLIRQNRGKGQLGAYISQLSLALSVGIEKSDFVDLKTTDSLKKEFYTSYKVSSKMFSKTYSVGNESELNSDIFNLKSRFEDQQVFLITKVSEVCGAVKVPANNAIDNYKAIINLDGDSLNLIALDRKSYFYIDYFEEYGNFFYELSTW